METLPSEKSSRAFSRFSHDFPTGKPAPSTISDSHLIVFSSLARRTIPSFNFSNKSNRSSVSSLFTLKLVMFLTPTTRVPTSNPRSSLKSKGLIPFGLAVADETTNIPCSPISSSSSRFFLSFINAFSIASFSIPSIMRIVSMFFEDFKTASTSSTNTKSNFNFDKISLFFDRNCVENMAM